MDITYMLILQDIVVGLMTQEATSSSETTGQSSELNNIGKLQSLLCYLRTLPVIKSFYVSTSCVCVCVFLRDIAMCMHIYIYIYIYIFTR